VQTAFVPLLKLFRENGHLNTHFYGIWLAHTAFGLPLAIFLLHNYIAALPSELFEAARIDGADHFAIFWRIVLPLTMPTLAAFAIFQFLWVWNDYLVALIFLSGNKDASPLTIQLVNLVTSKGQGTELLPSAAFISMVVPLIIFFALQRYFVRGLLAGSVKG
jgi:alpha-glucoside transport system permease protein